MRGRKANDTEPGEGQSHDDGELREGSIQCLKPEEPHLYTRELYFRFFLLPVAVVTTSSQPELQCLPRQESFVE